MMIMVFLICALALVIVAGVFIATMYYLLIQDVKKEVRTAPRIPMHVCDTHGPYPAKHTMRISIPQEGRPDLLQDMCIFCYDEAMKKAENVLKK
jgi:hypothetical protein